jgi:signal transduction histidine kinase
VVDGSAHQRRRVRDRFATIRVRITAVAVLAVAAALLIGGVALVAVMRSTLIDQVAAVTRSRAESVATALRTRTEPALTTIDDEQFVQVVDDDNRVVSASPEVAGQPPVVAIRPGQSKVVRPAFADDDFIAVAVDVNTTSGHLTVIVARSVGDVVDATDLVARLLAIGLPLLLLVVGFTVWTVTGRALAPVSTIRAEVDEISGADLHRRVAQPSGDDEVARLARTMNRMLGRLERSHARQQQFVSDASHELRSPVASIRQHAEVALAHPHATTVDELAGTVLAEDLRIQRLIEDLLLLARADEQTLDLRRQPVDVDDLVFDEARRLRAGRSVRVDTTAVSAVRTRGDAAGLRRVLRNVGDNAARHAASRIAFTLSQQADTVTIAGDDDGEGIPPDERERVLSRFVRLDAGRTRDDGGNGLGLAIAVELVHAHGGDLTVGHAPLGGARVEIRLPAIHL